jgi:hypothetical protein
MQTTEQKEIPGLNALTQLSLIISNLPFPWARAIPLINEVETALRQNASIDNKMLSNLTPFPQQTELPIEEAPAASE